MQASVFSFSFQSRLSLSLFVLDWLFPVLRCGIVNDVPENVLVPYGVADTGLNQTTIWTEDHLCKKKNKGIVFDKEEKEKHWSSLELFMVVKWQVYMCL